MALIEDSVVSSIQQRILNYEQNLIKSPFQSLPQPKTDSQAKYTVFDFNKKIKHLIKSQPYNLRWIGNGGNAPIQAYFYCILMLSASDQKIFIKLKNVFYEMCRKFLDFEQQKLLVEFFCLLEFSNEKQLFLKKYPVVQNIILIVLDSFLKEKQVKVNNVLKDNYDAYLSQNKISNKKLDEDKCLGSKNQLKLEKVTEIYLILSEIFGFIKVKKSVQDSFELRNLNNEKIFIIQQKQYFFVLQVLQIVPKKSKLSKIDQNEVKRLLHQDENKMQKNMFKQKQINKNKQFLDKSTQKRQINFKNNFKPFFPSSKSSLKNLNISHNINNKQQNQNHQKYIDLLESSFQQQSKYSDQQNDSFKYTSKKQPNKLLVQKGKTLSKTINIPSFLSHKNKSLLQKNQDQRTNKQKRSPSQIHNKYFTVINSEQKQLPTNKKYFKFYSPLKSNPNQIIKQDENSSQKKSLIKQKTLNKKIKNSQKVPNDKQQFTNIQSNPCELISNFDKNFSNEQINDQYLKKKMDLLPKFNPKVFNNRNSLQSRLDLGILCNFKVSKESFQLNKIPENNLYEEQSRRDFKDNKKSVRDELCQSLNYRSQTQLKNELFQKFHFKYRDLKFNSKRNESLEQKQTLPSQTTIPPLVIREQNKQPLQKTVQLYDGYQIRIIPNEKSETQRTQ